MLAHPPHHRAALPPSHSSVLSSYTPAHPPYSHLSPPPPLVPPPAAARMPSVLQSSQAPSPAVRKPSGGPPSMSSAPVASAAATPSGVKLPSPATIGSTSTFKHPHPHLHPQHQPPPPYHPHHPASSPQPPGPAQQQHPHHQQAYGSHHPPPPPQHPHSHPHPPFSSSGALEYTASDVQRALAEQAEANEHRARHDAWIIHDLRQALDAERAQSALIQRAAQPPPPDLARDLAAMQEQLRHTSAFADQWRVRGAQLEEVVLEKDKLIKRREEENVKLLRELATAKLLPMDLELSHRTAQAELAASERAHARTRIDLEAVNRTLTTELEVARADLVAALQGIQAVQGAMESWRKMAATAPPAPAPAAAPPSTTTAPATPVEDAMDEDDKDVDMGDELIAAGGGSGEPTPVPTPTRPMTAAEMAAEAVSLRQTRLVEELEAKVEAAKRAATGGGDDGTLRGGVERRGDRAFYV